MKHTKEYSEVYREIEKIVRLQDELFRACFIDDVELLNHEEPQEEITNKDKEPEKLIHGVFHPNSWIKFV